PWNGRSLRREDYVRPAAQLTAEFRPRGRSLTAVGSGLLHGPISIGRPSTRDIEYAAGREGAFLGCEPSDQRSYLLDEGEARHRDLRQHVADLRFGHLGEYVGPGGCGRHAIGPDPRSRELFPQRFGQPDYPRLSRGIGRRVRVAFLARDRGDIDDAAVIAVLHRGEHG